MAENRDRAGSQAGHITREQNEAGELPAGTQSLAQPGDTASIWRSTDGKSDEWPLWKRGQYTLADQRAQEAQAADVARQALHFCNQMAMVEGLWARHV